VNAKLVETEEKYTRFSKDASICKQKIADISSVVAEMKVNVEKDFEDQIWKNRENIERVCKALEEKVRGAAKQASKKAILMIKKTAENGVFFTGLMQI